MPPQQKKSVQIARLFVPEIKELLADRDFKGLKKVLKSLSALDLAETWSDFSEKEQTLLFRMLSDRDSTTLFKELETHQQLHLLKTLEDEDIEDLFEDFHPEDTSRLFKKLPQRTVSLLTRMLEQEDQHEMEEMETYPESTVGYWMHKQRIELHPSTTSSQALGRIRSSQKLLKGRSTDGYYVTDKNGQVVGYTSIRKIISAPSKTKIASYMNPVQLIRLDPHQDQEEAIQLFTKYQLAMAPVVDENNKLLGYIQSEDILPLAQQETTEDIQLLGAVEALEQPYFNIQFRKMIQKRGSWLMILFLGQLLTAGVMEFFEGVLERALVLALFVPLIISSGGNSGSQAATLIVRALALQEITFKDWWRVMRREILFGLTLGSILGLVGMGQILLVSQISPIYGPFYPLIGFTVGTAIVAIVIWGTTMGSLLPIFLRRLGLDPATASAPLVATIVDLTGLIIYFVTATIILKGTLL